MGNMMQETIANIWTGKILSKFRKNLLQGKNDVTTPVPSVTLMELCLEKIMLKNGIQFIRFNF